MKNNEKIMGKRQFNEMGNNEEAQDEGDSLAETRCFGEELTTFKATKIYVMGVRPWDSLGL